MEVESEPRTSLVSEFELTTLLAPFLEVQFAGKRGGNPLSSDYPGSCIHSVGSVYRQAAPSSNPCLVFFSSVTASKTGTVLCAQAIPDLSLFQTLL